MNYYTTEIKLDIQIAILDKILRFLSWYERRWKAYYIKKDFDRYYETIMNVIDMDKLDRKMVLGVFTVKEMEEAVIMKKLTDIVARGLI